MIRRFGTIFIMRSLEVGELVKFQSGLVQDGKKNGAKTGKG